MSIVAPLPAGYSLGAMTLEEAHQLGDWAAAEGWNPGLHDIRIAWACDPDAFVALREEARLAGGGTIFRHSPAFGFMGLFIMREDLRRRGLGTVLWQWRRDQLRGRLAPGATIGMDGVLEMVPFYARGGFEFAHRSTRFQGAAPNGHRDRDAVALETLDWRTVLEFDRRHFPATRERFLRQWLLQPGAKGEALVSDGQVRALGLARPCRQGHKLGPVFAETPLLAERLLGSLAVGLDGGQIQLDVPDTNAAGITLARQFGLAPVFACARLYLGPPPDMASARIFGLTSFEFG